MYPYHRPPTPLPLIHNLPSSATLAGTQPSKYILLLLAPLSSAGKVQIAKSVSSTLSVPLFQGDSLHETCAKAASVGGDGMNKERYKRMWLSKLTRTGLLFPEESKPAIRMFEGFRSGSRRGSGSSVASASSVSDGESSTSSILSAVGKFINKPILPQATSLGGERDQCGGEIEVIDGKGKKILLVLTHPCLNGWHKECIVSAVGEYGIGIIWVPLYEEELPVLNRDTMTSFGFSGAGGNGNKGNIQGENLLRVDVDGKVEEIIEEIAEGVRRVLVPDT